VKNEAREALIQFDAFLANILPKKLTGTCLVSFSISFSFSFFCPFFSSS